MLYLEDAKSQQLYSMNRRRCLGENYAYIDGKLAKYICKIYRFLNIVRTMIRGKYYDQCEPVISEYVPVKSYPYSKFPKTVIYTAVLGKYDALHEPFYTSDNYEFVLITDDKSMMERETYWNIVHISAFEDKIPKGLNNVQKNRWLKMNPDVLFPDYDISIYIDGCVNVVADMMPIIFDFNESKSVIGMHLHSNRKKITTEIRALLRCGKINRYDNKKALEQYENYKDKGFDDSIDLLEATIIIRKHNAALCKKIMKVWWREFINGVQRDQISLPYVIWSLDLKMNDIYILGNNEYSNPRFYISGHR